MKAQDRPFQPGPAQFVNGALAELGYNFPLQAR
ncbi:hypothetical protein BCF11_0932 [Collimonas sp. PA-H2]|nr:hypothetical protein BCF11_0932 [Collimonas sp. PA-H2]